MKAKLRKQIKEKVSGLSPQYCQDADRRIFQNIINLEEYQKAEVIFCYVGTKGEINTTLILEHILKSGKRLGVPKCISRGIMDIYEITNLDDMKAGTYGIMEPVSGGRLIKPEEIGFVCVPCLSCSKDGKRLGYGGGFYDRYLAKTTCPRAVLCRSKVMEEDIPVEEHDLIMDIVVTEDEVIRIDIGKGSNNID